MTSSPGRNRCALRNAVGDNIGDGCGRFDRSHANLPDKLRAALDEKFSVIHDAVLVSKAENDEVPCRIYGKNPT